MRGAAREVIAVDGKTLRGSKMSSDGTGALHLVSAYATEAGLVLAQRAVEGKSNEITAIPELLDMLNLKGAIVTIDAMGTQRNRPAHRRQGRRLRARPQRQSDEPARGRRAFLRRPRLRRDLRARGRDRRRPRPDRRASVPRRRRKLARRAPPRVEGPAILRRRHRPAHRRKNGAESFETRFYVSSLEPDPKIILAGVRGHWGIENNLHWTMDVTFNEDRCRTRKDLSPLNLAVIRHTAFNILKADKTPDRSDENASEPASTQNSGPTFSQLNDLGLCPVPRPSPLFALLNDVVELARSRIDFGSRAPAS